MFNKKILLASFALIGFIGASAQNSLLWSVRKENDPKTSYLFGSMHTNDSIANSFSREWWDAMSSCDVFAGEVDMSNTSEMMAAMQVAMMKDMLLSDLYNEEDMMLINDAIKQALDPMTAQLCQKMKPFFVLATILEAPKKDSPHSQIMDLRLQTIAMNNQKKVIGLETVTQQASSIDALSIEEQADLLLKHVKENSETQKSEIEMKKMMSFYLSQNLDSLYALSSNMDYPEKMINALLHERNNRFISKLNNYLENQSVFCAVGAMHLAGQDGMIAQLRNMGYIVEPVKFDFGGRDMLPGETKKEEVKTMTAKEKMELDKQKQSQSNKEVKPTGERKK